MPNEILWFMFALVNFTLLVVSYKLFGRNGLYAWVAMATILANLQVIKIVSLFSFTATLGNIMFGTLFLATDALNEKYGIQAAKKAVWVGFFTLVSTVVLMQMTLWFVPAADDVSHDALSAIFDFLPRLALASLTAYLLSQLLDVHLFQRIRKRFHSDASLFIRNLGSTFVSQTIDTLIFVPIAFAGVYAFDILLSIFLTTLAIKLVVAMLDTPFIYLIQRIKPLSNRSSSER